MKHFTAKFLTVCALIALIGSVQAQVVTIYQEQFANPGLPTDRRLPTHLRTTCFGKDVQML